jgi:hypothetical protein
MKNNGTLQKNYDKLTPRERLALIFAAIARDDEAERRVLLDTAPRALYRLSHHQNAFDVLQLLALSYLVNQLNRACSISTLAHVGEENDAAYRAARIGAYLFCVQADAWRAFCGELGIDPHAMLAGFEDALFSLEFAEKVARELAFTFEETRAEMVKSFGNDAEVITSERALNELRAVFNAYAERG